MDHVASVPSATSGRMAPEAIVLAVVLHAVAALALWYLAEHAPIITPKEDPIEVTIERSPPKPPEPPPPPPPQQAQPKPMPPPPPEGLKPPAEKEADKATSVRPSGTAPKDIAAPPQRSLEQMVPKPADQPKPPETAMVAPNPPSPVPPPDRPTLQPLPKPAPGPTVEPIPPRPPVDKPPVEKPPVEKPPTVARPQPQPQRAPPPPSLTPHQQPHPSPLVAPRPPSQPPAVARHQDTPTAPSSPFVNPAAEHARATAEQNYLWQVVSKLRGYRYHADVPVREGMTVVQVIIARDGRLLDAQVVSSSGVPAMDQGVLAGIRQGSPYAPLPASVSGPSARFRLPLVSVPDER